MSKKSIEEINENKLYTKATQAVMKRYCIKLRYYRGIRITYWNIADALNCGIMTVNRAFSKDPEEISTVFIDGFIRTMNINFEEFYREVGIEKEKIRSTHKSTIPKLILRGVPNKKYYKNLEIKERE